MGGKARPGGGNGTSFHVIKQLWFDILMAEFTGAKNYHEIAAITGAKYQLVARVVGSKMGQEFLAQLRAEQIGKTIDLQTKMRMIAEKGVEKIKAIMEEEDGDRQLQSKVYFQLADRIGFGPTKQINVNTTHKLTADDIFAIQTRVNERFSEDEIEELACEEVKEDE